MAGRSSGLLLPHGIFHFSEAKESHDHPQQGEAPNSRDGRLRRGIRYAQNRSLGTALIGQTESSVGESGAAHEFGEEFRGEEYPERPFMGPALERNIDRFGGSFVASIGE